MTLIFSDSFTESADTPLTGHTPDTGTGWVEVFNTTVTGYLVVSAALDSVGANADINSAGAGCRSNPNPSGAEYDVQATLSRGEGEAETGTKPTGFFFRWTDNDNTYFLIHYPNSHANNAENLYKRVGGTNTLLASVDAPEAEGNVYRLEVRDAAKKLFINDTEILSTSDNALTDAGSCGLFVGAAFGLSGHFRTPYQWDDYSVNAAGPPAVNVALGTTSLTAQMPAASVQNTGGYNTVTPDIQALTAWAPALSVQNVGGHSVVALDALSATAAAQRAAVLTIEPAIVYLKPQRLQTRLLQVPPRPDTPRWRLYVDWNNAWEPGYGPLPGDEITEWVSEATISIGNTDSLARVAAVGQADILLDNSDRRFSPANADGPYYGKLLPRRRVIIEAERDDWPQPIRLFTGRIRSIVPESQRYGTRMATIVCDDALGELQDNDTLEIPVQIDKSPDYILRLITSATFGGQAARNYMLLTRIPVANVDGLQVGARSYVWVTTPSAPGHVKTGTTIAEAMDNLAAAINAGDGIGTRYGSGTLRHPDVALLRGPAASIHIPATLQTAFNRPEVGNSGQYWQAQRITAPIAGQVSLIRVWIAEAEPGTVGYDLVVELRNDTGSQPGTSVLATASKSGGQTESYLDIPIVGPFMFHDTRFWVVFRSSTPARFFLYGAEGNFYPDGWWMSSADGGATWNTPGDYDLRIDVEFMPHPRLEALTEGAWGNNIAIWAIGSAISLLYSGAMAFGEDAPAGLIDFEADRRVLNVVGGEWRSGETNAMSAVQEVVESAGGLFWVARDGTLVYRSLDWLLTRASQPSALVIDDSANELSGQMALDDVLNVVTATVIDRREIVDGIIAQAPELIAAPGRWGQEPVERWSKNAPAEPGVVTLRLPYVNPDTGRLVAALSVAHPVAGTDYTVNDREDGTGFDYTNHGLLTFSIVPAGGELELTISNRALGTLYVRNLQIRGRRFTDAREVQITRMNEDSIALYGRRAPLALNLPFTISLPWAESYATYLLDRYSEPAFRALMLNFENPIDLGGRSVYEIELGDVIELTETQTATSGKYLVTGASYMLSARGEHRVMLNVRALDEKTYWVLGDPVYGVIESTARVGV